MCRGDFIITRPRQYGINPLAYHALATQLATQATNAILTLALYPRDIFQGVVRFLMLTILPAAFVGAIPLDIVRRLDWTALVGLVGFAVGLTLLSRFVFYAGLRRYESGSAINVNV